MIKKLLLIILCCLFFQSLPAISQNNEDCTDYPAVSKIERTVLGRTFQYENIYQRVNRIESQVLGTNFPNDALCDRIDRVARAASSSDSYAYNGSNSSTARQYMSQPLSSFNWQDSANSFYNNSSYDNQYSSYSQSSSTLQKILEFAIPILSGFCGNNNGYNNYYYGPGYQQEINRYQNSNFGAGVRILP